MSMHGCLITCSAFHRHLAIKNLGQLLTSISLIHPPLFKDLPCCLRHVICYVWLPLEACFFAFCQRVEPVSFTFKNFASMILSLFQ